MQIYPTKKINNKLYNMISIATLNIHNSCNSEQTNSTNDLLKLFHHHKFDIIGLQELYDINELKDISKGYNCVYNRHNVILSKYPMENILTENTKEKYVAVIIKLPNQSICVTNVHLNYKDENIRIKEMDTIQKKINPYLQQYPSILLGDFNSLTKQDYSKKQWGNIYEIRKYGKWELPVHQLTDKIKDNWLDSKQYISQSSILETCRYNTRIDYIYISNNINVKSYNVIETMPHISDHNLVTITFL